MDVSVVVRKHGVTQCLTRMTQIQYRVIDGPDPIWLSCSLFCWLIRYGGTAELPMSNSQRMSEWLRVQVCHGISVCVCLHVLMYVCMHVCMYVLNEQLLFIIT